MDINNYSNGFTLDVPSTVQTAFCDKTMATEIAQDFVLPDYQPEMRKLLRVTPSILPPSRFLGVGEAEFAGNISFTVLYIGSDGALYSTDLTAPYSFRIPIEGSDRFAQDRPICADAEISADTVITRLTAPRKLHIKCRLNAHLIGLYDEETDMRVSGDTTDTVPERLERTRQCARILFATGEAMELTDEMAVPVGEGELRLIETGGAVHITEATPSENGVSCRGELYWKAIVTRDPISTVFANGEGADSSRDASAADQTELLTRRIPFSQTVEMSPLSASGNWEAMAHATCTGITARVEEGKILCAATVVIEAEAMGTDKVTFVCDCFSPTHRTACDTRKYIYSRAVACVNGNVTESGTVSLSEIGIPQGSLPLDLSATAVLSGITCDRGHPVLSGECLYQLLYRSPEGEYGTAEFRLPLRYELPPECREEDLLEMSARATMLSGRARPDGEAFAIDAEWGIAARLSIREEIEAVDRVCFDGTYAERSGTCVLCYPGAGETLWGIAKRYHTALRPLTALNELPGAADPASPQSLENVHFLMIE